jgi:hypothetical protein
VKTSSTFNADKIMDAANIEILPDGTIKLETGKVSMPNHANAEAFIRELARLSGGSFSQTRRVNASLGKALEEHTHDGHTHSH